MGGHGALISALKNPGKFRSVSAFAPLCNPSQSSAVQKIFKNYFGDDTKMIEAYDATCLISDYSGPELNILIHQVMLNNLFKVPKYHRILEVLRFFFFFPGN